ncbi:hypothetical protein IWQ62_002374 [Dispira parvispora]|uniref:Late embryogenesis abundant protein LEA-2 subgroup domain-containing protein n=1 Tax=Dispira parvispora TaxID=1520584 RepID=A0A9W8AWV3_9FUNG|nr:hypothetical protein IWQ62_002374 [Dispira parvispora]
MAYPPINPHNDYPSRNPLMSDGNPHPLPFTPHQSDPNAGRDSVLDYYHSTQPADTSSYRAFEPSLSNTSPNLSRKPSDGPLLLSSQQPLADPGINRSGGAYEASPLSKETEESILGATAAGSPAQKSRFRRLRCCCCCHSRRSYIITAVVIVLLLVGIGLTLFFIWPRIPTVSVSGVTLTSSGAPGGGGSATRASDSNSLPLYFQIDTYNPNYIPWTVRNVTVDGHLKTQSTSDSSQQIDFPLGQGALQEQVTFPKFDNLTFELPFNLKLDPAQDGFQAASLTVLAACTSGDSLKFQYKAEIDISLISWTGYKPTIEDSASFDCPANAVEQLGLK